MSKHFSILKKKSYTWMVLKKCVVLLHSFKAKYNIIIMFDILNIAWAKFNKVILIR